MARRGRRVAAAKSNRINRVMTSFVGASALGRLSGLLLLALLIVVRIWDPAMLESIRGRTFDLFQNIEPRQVEAYPVTIIDIDERSLKEIGQWPWSRATIAEIVDRLGAAGVAAVGFDILFAEPDRLSPRRVLEALNIPDGDLKARLEQLPDSDRALAESLAHVPSVLGQAGSNAPMAAPTKSTPLASVATIGGSPEASLTRFPSLLVNLPELEAAAKGRGLVTVQPDPDGIIRRVPAVLSAGDRVAPTLSLELLRVASGATTLVVKSDGAGIGSVVVAGAEIPTDRDGHMWLHFSQHDPERFISAVDVLKGDAPLDRLQGKIAILGTSAVGLFDLRSTPVERVMPGVEIHAQAIESILADATLTRPNFATGAELVVAALIGLGIIVAVPMLGALPTLLLGALVALILCAGAWYLFSAQRMLIDIGYPLASSIAVFSLLTFFNYFREERRRTQIRTAFRQYLSPDLVDELSRDPDRLVLGGETREMTILFSDVRGFSTIAEGYKSNPSGLTRLMNRLLTPLSNAIIERRGTIDKYIGDAIMAFWNAPLPDADHALHAGEAALEILLRLDELNEERSREGERLGEKVPGLAIGIGISTGEAVVGNMGSDIRFDYSVMGDSVNLASRLEGLAQRYGLQILLAAETARQCGNRLAVLEVDQVRVKGRQGIETIFTLLGGSEIAAERNFRLFRGAFIEMLTHYRHRNWNEAKRALDHCRRTNERPRLDRLIEIYASRIDHFVENPPPADWDGVYG